MLNNRRSTRHDATPSGRHPQVAGGRWLKLMLEADVESRRAGVRFGGATGTNPLERLVGRLRRRG
jgi:hypothetical protein